MTRLASFARSILMLAVVAVGVPAALVWAARERFGGGHPMYGVPRPNDWSVDRVRSAFTDRLTDQTIADIVIRLSLIVAWVAVVVLLITVVAEVVHMARHDGLPQPDIRGLGMTQRLARVIASGLLVVTPLLTSSSTAIAQGGVVGPHDGGAVASVTTIESGAPTAATVAATPLSEFVNVEGAETADVTSSAVSDATSQQYVVQAGDSVYGIAERVAGPDAAAVADYAEQIIELNMGREMVDGRPFNNAAFIDVGWVLDLPAAPAGVAAPSASVDTETHVVEQGESLWSISEDELGDPERWPEIYEANQGKSFDGTTFADPSLIQPGWELDVPSDAGAADPADAEVVEAPADLPAEVTDVADVADVAEAAAAPAADDTGARAGIETAPPTAPDERSLARADNVWGHEVTDDAASTTAAEAGDDSPSDEAGVQLMTLGRAAMLSGGALTLLAARRRNQLRRARPRAQIPAPASRPTATERALRSVDTGDRFERVVAAVAALVPTVAGAGERVLAVISGSDGDITIHFTGAVQLPAPWDGVAATWSLPASSPIELLARDQSTAAPCPTLVQLGRDFDGSDVYVDLEALEAVEVGGPGAEADAIVAALAATLAGSTLAEVTTLVGVGVPDDAFLGHRLYSPARDVAGAFEAAAAAIGSTATMAESTFDLRASSSDGEGWEPAVVLAGASVGTLMPPANRRGLAVVSASPIHGPSARLAPDGDAWRLLPLDLRFIPVGLTAADVAALAELVTVDAVDFTTTAEPVGSAWSTLEAESAHKELPSVDQGAAFDQAAVDDDRTIVTMPNGSPTSDDADPDGDVDVDVDITDIDGDGADVDAGADPQSATPEYSMLVRLFGPIDVVDREGIAADFERSKTRELVAWLVTHRDRSTRSAARTALWELDVRDATFANVVSEARRALARLVPPPDGEEWVGRTMTESLPIHQLVVTDVDLVRHALDVARVQPPAQAIATLGPAVDLIAGMPFAGTSYLWPDAEGLTTNYVLLAMAATTELAAHCLSIGDVEGVFAATARGLAVLPGHEELIGLRMRAHAAVGDLAGVRHEWESYERVINGDPWSDGEPAAKLVELRASLLSPTS